MPAESFQIGILTNAFVTFTVSGTAFAFVIFLNKKWANLGPAMKAYAYFWLTTAIVWLGITIRYLLVVNGYFDFNIHFINELIVESTVFASGMALFYYLGIQLFRDKNIAKKMSLLCLAGGVVAIWQFVRSGGFKPGVITPFTADPEYDISFLIIFGTIAVVALILLSKHALNSIKIWRLSTSTKMPYEALYSLTLFIYVALGIIDQINLIIDWPLLVLRILYTAVFLFAFILLTSEEQQQNFLEQKT